MVIVNLKDEVIAKFSSNATQEWYVKKAESGLWGSEEVMIRKYFKPKSTILDIGCGTRRTTIHLHQLGYRVTGIDITPAMIDNAREIAKLKKLKIKYELGDATVLEYKDSSFDNALFSFNGWSMIPGKINRINALKEIFRVIKPGGFLIFTTLLRNFREFTLFWSVKWIRLFILKSIGFSVKEVDYGDYFYNIESTNRTSNQKQYMHRPTIGEVQKQLAIAGFELFYSARSDAIDNNNIGEAPPMSAKR